LSPKVQRNNFLLLSSPLTTAIGHRDILRCRTSPIAIGANRTLLSQHDDGFNGYTACTRNHKSLGVARAQTERLPVSPSDLTGPQRNSQLVGTVLQTGETARFFFPFESQSSSHNMWTEISRRKYGREGQRYAKRFDGPRVGADRTAYADSQTFGPTARDRVAQRARRDLVHCGDGLPKDFPPFTPCRATFTIGATKARLRSICVVAAGARGGGS
jgi:hypothetical protein